MTHEVGQDTLRAFLRAGGVVRMSEWLALDAETQAALEEAGLAVEAERALLHAGAIRGAESAVSALIDGGYAAEETALASSLSSALNGKRIPRG